MRVKCPLRLSVFFCLFVCFCFFENVSDDVQVKIEEKLRGHFTHTGHGPGPVFTTELYLTEFSG